MSSIRDMAKKNPCYSCKIRYVGCHSKCTPFSEWTAEREKLMEKISRGRRVLATSNSERNFRRLIGR